MSGEVRDARTASNLYGHPLFRLAVHRQFDFTETTLADAFFYFISIHTGLVVALGRRRGELDGGL